MQKIIAVEGMTCEHCVQTLSQAVDKIIGVKKVEVNLEQKEVMVDFDDSQTQVEQISARIKEAGFEVV